jgi:hypothetical protein
MIRGKAAGGSGFTAEGGKSPRPLSSGRKRTAIDKNTYFNLQKSSGRIRKWIRWVTFHSNYVRRPSNNPGVTMDVHGGDE